MIARWRRAWSWRLAATLMLASLAASPAPAQNDNREDERQKIFEKVFGSKPPRQAQQKLDLPLIIGGEPVAQIPAVIAQDEAATKFLAEPLLGELQRHVVPEILTKLADTKDSDGYVSIGALRAAGLGAKLDPATLSLVLDIPLDLRALQSIDLAHRAAAFATPPIAPATLSSYLNVRGGVDYVHESSAAGAAGLQPVNLGFESATNLLGFVLQGDLSYIGSSRTPWQRGDVSLVHDEPDDAVRYQVGDLAYPVTAFQAFEPLGGITIARNFTLQPYRIVQPGGEQNFVLTSPSRVQVQVNGQTTQILQLPAGRYNLQNFAFTQGANNVQLNITDAVGRTATIASPFFFSSTLLQAGLQDFSYSLGAPSTQVDGDRNYAVGHPAASAFHRIGVTDRLTLGGNFQGDGQHQMAGAEAGTATPFGNFTLNFAQSRISHIGSGSAAQLQYTYFNASTIRDSNRAVTASATYHSIHFAPLGVVLPQNPDKLDLTLGYTQALPFRLTGSLAGTYSFQRGGHDANSVDLSLRRVLTRYASIGADLSRTTDALGHTDYRGLFSLTFQFTRSRQFVNTSYDTRQHTGQIAWSYIPPSDVGHPSASLNFSEGDQQRTINGALGYNTSRLETNLIHDESEALGTQSGAGTDRRTTFNFGTALLFADAHVAIGRPVGDSFVLVVPRSNLSDLTVDVNPIGNQLKDFEARTDFLGPAAITGVIAYQDSAMRVVVPDLPVGYSLGPDTFHIKPTFHSGTVLEVGSDAVVLLDGRLVDKEGEPLALIAGFAVGEDGKKLEFFTNRTGRFRIEGMKPGTYKLSFPSLPDTELAITIPAGTKGIYRIGTIDSSTGKITPPSAEPPPQPPRQSAEPPPGVASAAAPPGQAPATLPSPPPAAAAPPASTTAPLAVLAAPRPPEHVAAAPAMTPSPPALVAPLSAIDFAPGSARLDRAAARQLAEAARMLRRQGGRLRVIGYAPQRGEETTPPGIAARFTLALDRASAVALALARHGVPATRILIEAAPPADPADEADRAEIVVETGPAGGGGVVDIVFPDDSAELPMGELAHAREAVSFYKRHKSILRITAHAGGPQGADSADLLARFELALDRARAVAEALMRQGVPGRAIRVETATARMEDNDEQHVRISLGH
jgi:outer membrane usher protein